LEGPIIKGRTSFLLAGRSTYSDWILKKLRNAEFNKSTASFYDLNLDIGHKIDDNNHLTLSAYNSRDEFKLNTDTLYSYTDRNAALKWAHRFNQKLFGELTATASEYRFSMASEGNPINAFGLEYSIRQYQAKSDFNYILNQHHTLHGGLSSILYYLKPGSYLPRGAESLVIPDVLEGEKGLESAVYLGDNIEVNAKLSFYLGVRYSQFSYLAPREVFQYRKGSPLEVSNIVDTVQFSKGVIKPYQGPEPRINARYMLSKNSSVKFSYGRTRQYIQMLSNNTAIAPTDIWKLSDQYIKPQISDQFSIGWFKTDVLNAKGKSYGAEFMIQKSVGRLNGWISYTYSRSFLKSQSQFAIETVNKGKYYPSNFDKPHAVNVISNYKFNRRINISLNLTYSTGRPITLPLAKFESDGVSRLIYSDRNAYRVPDYFRSDISINIEGNHKIKKLAHSSWTLAVYNLTGRRNAYSIFFVSENNKINGYKLSVFGQAIPTITYNFRM
jgi:TonB dependent receptor